MIKRAITLTLLFLLIVTFTKCRTSRTSHLKKQYKAIYIDQFKLTYFKQMLVKSYSNSEAIQEIIHSDHSGFTEPILTEEDYALIDSLTTTDNEKIIADSAQGDQRAEGAQGKRPLGYILNRLDSKWLDSIARKRIRISGIPDSWTK
jgi:hypothetical protein